MCAHHRNLFQSTAEFLKERRTAAKAGHLAFTDVAGRTLALPFSIRGLAKALDELARETSRDAGKDNG